MIKIKITTLLIIAVFPILYFLLLSQVTDFKEWISVSPADFGVISILNSLGVFIFSFFASLYLLRHFYQNYNIKRHVTHIVNNQNYIVVFSIVLTLTVPLTIFKVPFIWFIAKYSIISFVYIFAVATICIRIIFNK